MEIWRQVRHFRLDKLRHAPRYLRALPEILDRRRRVAAVGSSDTLQTFWRQHGFEWGQQQASDADLMRIGTLAHRTIRLDEHRAAAEIIPELKAIWSAGFTAPADAFGWDDMNDQLPASAMVAFVRGAGEAWSAKHAEA